MKKLKLLLIFINFLFLNSTFATITCNTSSNYCGSGQTAKIITDGSTGNIVTVATLIGQGCLLSAGSAANTPQYIVLDNISLALDDRNYSFAEGSMIWVIGGNTQILINSGYTLSIGIHRGAGAPVSSRVGGCGNSWGGFSILSGAKLIVMHSEVEDAQVAIAPQDGSSFTLYDNIFKRCKWGIRIDNGVNIGHYIIANSFYGDEDLYSPLSGKPFRGIQLTGCQPFRITSTHFFDYESPVHTSNPDNNSYPIYLKNTSFSMNSCLVVSYYNHGIYAISTKPIDKANYLLVQGGEIENYIGPGTTGSGIYADGCNLSVLNTNVNEAPFGITYNPKTNNELNITGGIYASLYNTAISINHFDFSTFNIDFSGKIKDVYFDVPDEAWAMKIDGRRGTKELVIENNEVDFEDTGSGFQIHNCDHTKCIHNQITGNNDGTDGIVYNDCNDNILYYNIIDEGDLACRMTNSPHAWLECNQLTNSLGTIGTGLALGGRGDATYLKYNSFSGNEAGIFSNASNLPLQTDPTSGYNFGNQWPIGTNGDNCIGVITFEIESANNTSAYDPGPSFRINGKTDPSPSCSYTPGGGPDYPDPTYFKTAFLDDIVTSSLSYSEDHEGETFDDSWYGFGVFNKYPELLEDYEDAETFYDEVDITNLGQLYAVYHGLINLSSDLEVESDSLAQLMNEIKEQELLLLQTQDSIDIDTVSTKNDSLVHVIDSLTDYIEGLVEPADSIRDSIEVAIAIKLSDLSSQLSGITPSDSIEITLKYILSAWIYAANYDTLTNSQLLMIRFIANKCYYKFGTAVRLARLIFPVADEYDVYNCGESIILSSNDNDNSSSITIKPNPVNDLMKITIEGFNHGIISVYNIQGIPIMKELVTSTNSEINVNTSNWTAGCYFVHFKSDQTNRTTKVTIVK